MKRLKQIEESRRMISDAFIMLLQDKPMDEITISQIAVSAGIGRNTFYNHFQKKEDIVAYLMQRILTSVKEKVGDKSSVKDFLLWRFTFIKQNPLLAVFNRQRDIKQLLFHFRVNNMQQFNFPVQKDAYATEFLQGGLDYVTSKWIVGGMKESPEDMADKVLSLIKK